MPTESTSILIVTPFAEGPGGVAVAVRELANEFERAGRDVFVLTRGPSSLVRQESESLFRIRFRAPLGTVRSWCSSLLFLPVTLFGLWRLTRRLGVSVVLIQYAVPAHFSFGLLRLFSPARLFVVFQGSDAHRISSVGASGRWCYTVLLRNADGVFAVASSLLAKVRAAVPEMTPNTGIIPNGTPLVTPTVHRPTSEDGYAITVGVLIPRKGIDVLIRAIALLRRRGIDQRVMVVGIGDDRQTLGALANSEGVADLVVFAGSKPHGEVLDLIVGSDFFVLASRAEGLPLVVVEAMMCGRAVVATHVDGVPDVVSDGHTGLLVPPDSPEQLADAMQRVIQDRRLREQLGAAGRVVADRFRWSEIARRYLTAFAGAAIADAQRR
jgi:glycosyltransferase involved in cell wall biosynthesis